MIYGHGDDAYKYPDKVKANFSSCVWPEPPHPRVVQLLREGITALKGYPEPNGDTLCSALATFHQVTPAHVLATNGAAEAFYLIAQAFHHTDATIYYPTFAEYEDAAVLHEIACQFQPFSALTAQTNINTRLAFICNPNNPTGEVIPANVLLQIIRQNPDTIFVIDEAYSDLTASPQHIDAHINALPNVFIVHSMTKTFSLPGLRIGYVLAAPALIQTLLRYKIPWSVNAMALQAATFLIQHHADLKPNIAAGLQEATALCEAINAWPAFTAMASTTHFFLVKLNHGTAAQLKTFLIEQHGCLIRDAANFRGLGPAYIRVAAQSPKENERLRTALHEWNSTHSASL